MLKTYGLSFQEVLDLKLNRFWFLVNQADRIRAEEDLRQLNLLGSAQSGEAYEKAVEALSQMTGQIYVWKPAEMPSEIRIDPQTGLDPEFDREGLRRLRKMAAEMSR